MVGLLSSQPLLSMAPKALQYPAVSTANLATPDAAQHPGSIRHAPDILRSRNSSLWGCCLPCHQLQL